MAGGRALVRAAATIGVGIAAVAAPAAAGHNPHPIHPQISWTATRHVVSGSGCSESVVYTIRITGSVEYLNEHIQTYPGEYYAGKKAVVELFGPDYSSRPRETKVVGHDGTFTVAYRAHTCAKAGQAGVAMVSVGRFAGMHPSLAATVPKP